MENRDNKRKTLAGKVVSDKMNKTRVIEVTSTRRHPKYGKLMNTRARYKAHDEKNESHLGDTVEIMSTRPLSRDKCWAITRIVAKNLDQGVAV